MLILAIDTSTDMLSVALVRHKETLAVVDEVTKKNQSEILMPCIERMMHEGGLKPEYLDLIAVANGPGSYTGIRVGVAAAKSLAYALDIPVVPVSSLEVMAHAAGCGCTAISLIDARRGTVFAGVYGAPRGEVMIPEGHYELGDLLARLPACQATFIGNGALANQEVISATRLDAVIIGEARFKQSKACAVAELALKGGVLENYHQLVPNYLRRTEAEINLGGGVEVKSIMR